MLDRLKAWHYRRRFGPERADLILRMEREMRAMPPELLSMRWIEWFWLQPPDSWEEAMTMRRRGETHPNEPPEGETVRRRPMTPEEAQRHARNVRESLDKIFEAVERNTKLDLTAHERAAAKFRQAATLMHASWPSLPERWQAWVGSLPEEARHDGAWACRLWLEMLELREALREAITERKTLAGIHAAEARRVMDVRMFTLRARLQRCDEAWQETAGPFFERHGRPPVEGFQRPKPKRHGVVPPDFERRLEIGLRPVEALSEGEQARLPNDGP